MVKDCKFETFYFCFLLLLRVRTNQMKPIYLEAINFHNKTFRIKKLTIDKKNLK